MKKRRLTRVMTLALALAVALCALAGCGKASKKSDAELIVGKWEGSIDIATAIDAAGKAMGGSGSQAESIVELFKEIDISGISVKMNTEFKADGTFTSEVDGSSYETAMNTLLDRMTENLPEIMRKYVAEAAGVDVSEITDDVLDRVLAGAGVSSWEEFGEMIAQQVKGKDFAGQVEGMKRSGKYAVKDGLLYTTEDPDKDPAEEEGTAYKVSENSLTLTVRQDKPAFELEVTFKRAG